MNASILDQLVFASLEKLAGPYGGYQAQPFTPQQFTPGQAHGIGAGGGGAAPQQQMGGARSRLQARRNGQAGGAGGYSAPGQQAGAQGADNLNVGAQHRAYADSEAKRIDNQYLQGQMTQEEYQQAHNQLQEAQQQFAQRQQMVMNRNKPNVQDPTKKTETPQPQSWGDRFMKAQSGQAWYNPLGPVASALTASFGKSGSVIDMLVKDAAGAAPAPRTAIRGTPPVAARAPMATVIPPGQMGTPQAGIPITGKPALPGPSMALPPAKVTPGSATVPAAPGVAAVKNKPGMFSMGRGTKAVLGGGALLGGTAMLTDEAKSQQPARKKDETPAMGTEPLTGEARYGDKVPRAGREYGMGFDHPALDIEQLAKMSAAGAMPMTPAVPGVGSPGQSGWLQQIVQAMGGQRNNHGMGGGAQTADFQTQFDKGRAQNMPNPVGGPQGKAYNLAAPASNAAGVGSTVAPPAAAPASAASKAAAWALSLDEIL